MIKADWLTVGAGFGPNDEMRAIRSFMANLGRAGRALEFCVGDSVAVTGVSPINLICRQRLTGGEPEVNTVPPRRDRTYTVAYDWLSDRFLDSNVGPWNILAVLALALVAIAEDGREALPSLPEPENPGMASN